MVEIHQATTSGRNHDGNGQTLSVKSAYKYKTSNSKLKICTQ